MDCLQLHRTEFAARQPDAARITNADQIRIVAGPDLVPAPQDNVIAGQPPRYRSDPTSKNKYLWVLMKSAFPFGHENILVTPPLREGRLTHTNLSAGAEAHTAGEVWFKDAKTIWISGGSGRYKTRSSGELDSIVECLKANGFDVTSLGWDGETNSPNRVLSE